jgi:hypothetical protein
VRSFIIYTRYSQECDISKAYGVNEDMRNPYRILVGKCEGKRLFGQIGGKM